MRFLVKLLVNALAVYLTATLLKGVHLNDFWTAVIVALVLVLLNATLKPILVILTIPATILTLGLFLVVINAIIILAASWLLAPKFSVDNFWWALLFSIILSFINSILQGLIMTDDRQGN